MEPQVYVVAADEPNLERNRKYVKDVEASGKIPVRLAVYDSQGNFQGYKTDSEWNLRPNLFKPHPVEDALPSGHLIRNLLWKANATHEMDPERASKVSERYAYIVAEQVDSDINLVNGLFGYHLRFNEESQTYEAA